jgi:hypothetical protein
MNKEIHESPITVATITISYCHYFHVQGFHISDHLQLVCCTTLFDRIKRVVHDKLFNFAAAKMRHSSADTDPFVDRRKMGMMQVLIIPVSPASSLP